MVDIEFSKEIIIERMIVYVKNKRISEQTLRRYPLEE